MIFITHHSGGPHGILGAQLAASFFEKKCSIPSRVIGVERNFSKEHFLHYLDSYYERKEKVIAFSHLCGRNDLLHLIQDLKQRGFLTLLGGPQAKLDYDGEPLDLSFPHRFKGLKSIIDIAYQGPVEGFKMENLTERNICLEHHWTRGIWIEVDWSNLYTFSDHLKKIEIQVGQVLQAIGCPYSNQIQTITLPPPVHLSQRIAEEIEVKSRGCSFCDVSRDKGFHGRLDRDQVIHQIERLPEHNGRKIPFELIDEYPVGVLGDLLEGVRQQGIKLSQIHLVCRVDDINTHAPDLLEVLSIAKEQNLQIMFASIGFESFSNRLLHFFCKGITLDDIIECVETLRRLKDRFGAHFLYRRDEGANHGFIRPTPWDDGETMQEMDRNIFLYRFFEDILPEHSTPLIIHHASFLGDWVRQIESKTGILFGREGTWIEWWNPCSEDGG